MTNTPASAPAPRAWFFPVIIVALAISTYLMSDMISPALPQLCHDFAITSRAAKHTIGLYLLGMILPQLVLGPLSDAFGRKPIIMSGLLIAMIGSLLGVMAHSISVLNIARLLQGIGAGAISLNARAMGRDLYSGKQLVKLSAYIGTTIGVAPALAPLLGGYLQHTLHWQATFIYKMLHST